jgi:hypothetical protein
MYIIKDQTFDALT